MKNRFIKAQPKDIIGSSFVGYLQVEYEALFDRFSFPNDRTRKDEWQSADQKTRFEWAFKLLGKESSVITIYDYKDPREIQYVDTWHIGFKGDMKKLVKFFEEQRLLINIP